MRAQEVKNEKQKAKSANVDIATFHSFWVLFVASFFILQRWGWGCDDRNRRDNVSFIVRSS
jgi:hypothetical protein